MAQQRAKLRRGDAAGDGLVAHAEAAHVFLRKIDAVLGEVDAHILPEVGELQRGAGGVGEAEVLFIHFAAGIEHKAADGIGRVAAVAQHVVHGLVARDGLVLAKGDEQIGERLLGNRAGADGFSQRDKHRMARAAFVAGVQFPGPTDREAPERGGRVADFVAQIVGDAAVGIDGMKVRPQRLGQKPRGDVEVFVVRLGQLPALGARFFERGRDVGNAIRRPAAQPSRWPAGLRCPAHRCPGRYSCRTHSNAPQGTMAVLISLERFISFSKTRFSS